MRLADRFVRLAAGATVLLCSAALAASQTSASADGPPTLALSQIPQCKGVTHGTARLINASWQMTSVQPPPSFNPLAASDAELACYGFPARPDDPVLLQNWEGVMQHSLHYRVPEFDQAPSAPQPQTGTVANNFATYFYPSTSPQNDYPWSGYAMSAHRNTGWTNLKWTYVQGEWIVPSGHTYCQGNGTAASDSPWVGLGGDGWDGGNGSALIQTGTNTINAYPTPVTQFFWEDYSQPSQPVSNFPVYAGDSVFVEVTYNGNQTTTFFLQDNSSSNFTSFTKATTAVDLSSAEFINEDQPRQVGGDFVALPSIGVPFQLEYAQGTWGSTNQYSINKGLADNETLTEFTAYKGTPPGTSPGPGPQITNPSAVSSYGDFTDYTTANAKC